MATFVKKHPDDATFCGASEFYDRRFKAMEQAYHFKIPKSGQHQNQLPLDYVNVAKGQPCNFAEVFTTDARIKTQNLVVLKDPKPVFLTQLAALTVREKTYKKYPKLQDFAKTIGSKLTQDEVIDLNKMVDVDGKSAEAASKAFLSKYGFVKNGKAAGGLKGMDFSGATFTVGSKEFTEQKILGHITYDALKATGANVKSQIGLQGTTIVRKALQTGKIDMYWEYSGTGWSLFLKHQTPVKGKMAQFKKTAQQDLAKNHIKWLGPADYGNAYAVARRTINGS
jgi:glycine betaine/choline ABC-type transport system substrate-binding protein